MLQYTSRVAVLHSRSLQHLFSTTVSGSGFAASNINLLRDDDGSPSHEQEFVRERFTDSQMNWNNRARVISTEDFENRPKVSFSEEFQSLYDAGVVLSWIPSKQQDAIYQMYLDSMLEMQKTEKNGVTSHEYVMHMIAKKFNISAKRVAAIVQLSHNEDQIRRTQPNLEIHHDVQNYVDRKIAEHIRNAYSEYDEIDPQTFVETPDPYITPPDERHQRTVRDDVDLAAKLYDLEKKETAAKQQALDTRLYAKDVDDNLREVELDKEAKQLLSKKKELDEALNKTIKFVDGAMASLSGQEYSRSRWKYVAKIINTSSKEQKKDRVKRRHHHRRDTRIETIKNTIVEHDGDIRPATVAEAIEAEWKPTRDSLEFIYKDVKKAWLEKTLRGKVGGWGRVAQLEKNNGIREDNDESFSEVDAKDDEVNNVQK